MQQHSLSRSSQYCSTLLVARMKDDTSLIWLNFKFSLLYYTPQEIDDCGFATDLNFS